MSELVVFLFLLILIALFSMGICYMQKQFPRYNAWEHALVAVCSRGIYALCFAEGYVILLRA